MHVYATVSKQVMWHRQQKEQ